MAAGLHDLSIAELSGLIAARTLSPVELVEALIRRVEDCDAQTHAFITPTFDLARRQAREAEAEIKRSCSPAAIGSDRPPATGHRQGTRSDRKSTRLNSSHGYISYAV